MELNPYSCRYACDWTSIIFLARPHPAATGEKVLPLITVTREGGVNRGREAGGEDQRENVVEGMAGWQWRAMRKTTAEDGWREG